MKHRIAVTSIIGLMEDSHNLFSLSGKIDFGAVESQLRFRMEVADEMRFKSVPRLFGLLTASKPEYLSLNKCASRSSSFRARPLPDPLHHGLNFRVSEMSVAQRHANIGMPSIRENTGTSTRFITTWLAWV